MEVVIAVAVVILSNLFYHGSDIITPLSISDLEASSDQTVLVEVRAIASPPATAADEAELRPANASVDSVNKEPRSEYYAGVLTSCDCSRW